MSSNLQIPRVCQFCGKDFIAKTTVTKYCGDSCAKKAYKHRKRQEKIEVTASLASQTKNFVQNQLNDKAYLIISETCLLLGASRMTIYRQIKR